jgi:hypothetical protein
MMRTQIPVRRGLVATAFALLLIPAFAGMVLAGPRASIADVRQVTEKYHDINAALADGYVFFYKCTEQPGVGTMGQHLVKLSLVGDPSVNALTPEVLVYAPKRNGEMKLVAVEYVTLDTSSQPHVLGQPMLFRPAGNRYGLPDFYERHAWLWQGNPRGTFDDWNPDISCLGTGDNGG